MSHKRGYGKHTEHMNNWNYVPIEKRGRDFHNYVAQVYDERSMNANSDYKARIWKGVADAARQRAYVATF